MPTYPTVGGLSYSILTGTPDMPAEQIEEIPRKGRDGVRWRREGLRSGPAWVRAVAFCADAEGVTAAIEAAKALRGTTVNITDAHDITWYGCKVEDVRIENVQAVFVNGVAKKRLTIIYQVRMNWA